MGRDRESSDIAELVLGVGAGLGLAYVLSRLLEGRVGGGGGAGGAGRLPRIHRGLQSEGGRKHAAPVPASAPAMPATPAASSWPTPSVPEPRPRDEAPVEILVRPSGTDPAVAVIEMEGRIVSVGEVADRIDAGGRRDVRVAVRGDTREGGWQEIRRALEFLGIEMLLRQL